MHSVIKSENAKGIYWTMVWPDTLVLVRWPSRIWGT